MVQNAWNIASPQEAAKGPEAARSQGAGQGQASTGGGKSGGSGRTFIQLYNEAKARGLKGRSAMNKAQLERELSR